ncbi:hypothetical protein N9L92_03765 [Saprospiraceae bacterium]|nr:hypothetical protein [Saprospiraceae bacterium]
MKNLKINFLLIATLALLLISCKENTSQQTEETTQSEKKEEPVKFQNKGHELVYKMVQKVGNYEKWSNEKNATYTYTYKTPDGKTDISTEKYLFEGELSYGKYEQHERTLPDLKGEMEQGYDGKDFWLKIDGDTVTDGKALKAVKFNRATNYYWFSMLPKLLDSGLTYESLGEKNIADKMYDVVKVSFETKDKKPKDTYQLYINKKTSLVDQFLFTVVDFGIIDTPMLMQVQYETIEGFKIPTRRKYKKSTWNADVSDAPWIEVFWTDIKFNTDITEADFKK